MLECTVNLQRLNDAQLKCGDCKKCIGKSKLDYPFRKDLWNSEALVTAIKEYVEDNTPYHCEDTKVHKNPDLNVFDNKGQLICRIESKYLEGQAFMMAWYKFGLYPKETLVIDEPKLDSYIECKEIDRNQGMEIPIFVVWKFDKPCDDIGGITVFQEIDELERIRTNVGRRRAYERRTGANDYSDGVKLGVTRKYHYSIRECEPIENLPERIIQCGEIFK